MRRWWMVLIAPALTTTMVGGAAAGEPDYRLGPQDQLQIRVFDLRTGTGEAYQWAAFNDDFTVGASGKVALPLLGELPAGDRTTADLAGAIADKLQARVGLAQRPDVSVQITKYRPFYVTGSVDKPGEYEFRPDMTVLQAVSMAGGLARVSGEAMLGFAHDALTARGDLRLLDADRVALLCRQARLDAEINGLDTIRTPPDVQARSGDPMVARLVREEQMLFESRRFAISSQVDALGQTKLLLQKQVVSLNAKDESLAHQLDIIKRELDQVSSLVSKGLAVLPRQLAIEQSSAQFESDRLDVQLAILRAQQDSSKADRDILELRNTRRNDALQEATEVHNKLAETAEKLGTAQSLVFQAEVRAPMAIAADAGAVAAPTYLLTRRIDGKASTQAAKEGDTVQPGDVVKVEPKGLAGGATSAPVN